MNQTCNCNCTICTLQEFSDRKVGLFLPTQTQYPILGVGQAPEKTERVTGQPFTGSAGKHLYGVLLQAGLYKSQMALGNLVMCKPPNDGKGNDRAPTSHEQECCLAFLRDCIWQVRPELILSFGGPATQALTGKGPITTIHGGFFPLLPDFEWECQVLALFHPSYTMRQRQQIPVMVRDLQKVHSFFTSDRVEVTSKKELGQLLLDPTLQELQEYLYNGTEGEVVAFDTETTSLNTREAHLLGASFSRSETSACAVYFTPDDPRRELIYLWLESRAHKKATQNGTYDCAVLKTNGCEVCPESLVYDTRLAEQLINSDGKKDLNHLRAVYTDIAPYKPTAREMKEIHLWGKERMLQYAALDALCTKQVMEKQKVLLSVKQKNLLSTLLLPVSFSLSRMERRGMKVDVGRLALMYADTLPKIEALEEEIRTRWGINPNSPKQIGEKFHLISTDRETLDELIRREDINAEAFRKIQEYRDLSKGAATFLRGVYTRLEGDRIHTSYNLEGTGTGRLSSSNPNLQNIRKPFRIIYISDSEDMVLLACDYKQMELRIVAALAPCSILQTDLDRGVDIHGKILELIADNIPERFQDKRMIAKSVVFGTLYGRSPYSVAKAFGVAQTTAKFWQEACFSKYPGLKMYVEEMKACFLRQGYVETPYGRRRYVQNERQAVNAPVQSTANDVALDSLLRVDRAGLDLCLTTHDELVIQCRRQDVKEVAMEMRRLMEREVEEMGGKRFPVDIKQGDNWYEVKEVK